MFSQLLLLAASAAVSHAAAISKPLTQRSAIIGLPQMSSPLDFKFQPYLDYDTDSCYNVAAIDPSGVLNPGINPDDMWSLTDKCRNKDDLYYNNVYARNRCNNGRCAILYDYYFEVDIAQIDYPDNSDPNVNDQKEEWGHQHEWEHIIVWVDNNQQATHVSVSQHTSWQTKEAKDVAWEGSHPKIVYHKDSGTTHNFRFAEGKDLEFVENDDGKWQSGALVSWFGYPSVELRDKLVSANWGDAAIALGDGKFTEYLTKTRPAGYESFDPAFDDDSSNKMDG